MKPTPQQDEIFKWFEKGSGHLVVRARAGTGKTTTILLGIEQAPEKNVLVTAFNSRIVKEAAYKISKKSWGNREVVAKTLHAVGFSICLRKGCRLDTKKLQRHVEKVMTGDDLKFKASAVKDIVSKAKGMVPFAKTWRELEPIVREFQIKVSTWPDPKEPEVLCTYALKVMQSCLTETSAVDYDDQIFMPLVLGWTTPMFDLVVVDEAQDMNYAQNELAMKICGGRVCVVGDDRQAIYRFRGADIFALDRMGKLLKAKELKLTYTFRCGKLIVDMARGLVPDYEAGPKNPDGQIIDVELAKLVKHTQPGDAILSRKNAPLMRLCLQLVKDGQRAGIAGRDVLSTLRTFVEKALRPTTVEGLLRSLDDWEAKEVAKCQKRKQVEKEAETRDKAEVVRAIAEGADSIKDVYDVMDRLFVEEGSDPGILLSSVHKAKGLEWERVFLIEDTFRTTNIEEQNIRYVAITRAKTHLYLVQGKLV